MSLPTLLGYQRASAFVNATKLASQPLFSSDEEYKISNVLSNTFFIDIDHVSIAIHIVIVLSPSPRSVDLKFWSLLLWISLKHWWTCMQDCFTFHLKLSPCKLVNATQHLHKRSWTLNRSRSSSVAVNDSEDTVAPMWLWKYMRLTFTAMRELISKSSLHFAITVPPKEV